MAEEPSKNLRRLQSENESLRQQVEETEDSLAGIEDHARSLQEERDRLSERLKMAEARLREEPRAPALPASEVSALVNRFLSDLHSQLSGMAISDGELQLNVAFEKVGEQQGFVVPTAASPPEVRANLHTISVRLTPEIEG